MQPGIRIEAEAPAIASAPQRSDVACFVGYVARRTAPGGYTRVPAAVRDALDQLGWLSGPYQRAANVEALLDVPVVIDSWDVFDHLFDGEARSAAAASTLRQTAYLAAAVRSFFAQGGRRCWMVRVGDPWPYATARDARIAAFGGEVPLIPGYTPDNAAPTIDGTPADPQHWHGVTHLFGLDEVSFLCVPDLADALRVDAVPAAPVYAPPAPPEQFIECSTSVPAVIDVSSVQALPAPLVDGDGYLEWARAIGLLRDLVSRTRAGLHRRDVQLIAALPLPCASRDAAHANDTPAADPLRFLQERGWLAAAEDQPAQLGSAFVQLAYPWLASERNPRLPAGLESPDGVLAGLVARNALLRGAFRSAAGSQLIGVRKLFPELSRAQQLRSEGSGDAALVLADKLSLIGPSPLGFKLVSDVTMSASADWRAAGVNRLMGVILRAARRVGEDLMFESSGEALWAKVAERLGSLMDALWRRGALAGNTAADAYSLRCDRTTMTQDDLDNGRVIATLAFVAAQPLETISVSLCLSDGGVGLLEAA